MRKLASVQKIKSLAPIPGADRIEVAEVLGWRCVVAKSDQLKVGDLVVYFEIDTLLPPTPVFEFMRERKFRVRTIKLRGQVSQGLVMPLKAVLGERAVKEGLDLTAELGVKKYDPEADAEMAMLERRNAIERNRMMRYFKRQKWYQWLFNPPKMRWPDFLPQTDEVRVQTIGDLRDFAGQRVFVTEKLDGSSATYCLAKRKRFFNLLETEDFMVCSRTVRIKYDKNNPYWRAAEKYQIKNLLKALIGDNQYVAVQGELLGKGLPMTGKRDNRYGVTDYVFHAFNLWLCGARVNYNTMRAMIGALSDVTIPLVPLISTVELPPEITAQQLVEQFALGRKSILNPAV